MLSYKLIAGVDEVGRGPLVGPVVTAAVILNPDKPIHGLKDSKQLTEKKRETLAKVIKENALCYAYGRAEAQEIDAINILQASLVAMQRAISALEIQPDFVYVDGPHCPLLIYPVQGVIKGDQLIAEISAASILAKVARDQEMLEYDILYPGYGFAKHKGYPTKEHLDALNRLGPTPLHRYSFEPVRKVSLSPVL